MMYIRFGPYGEFFLRQGRPNFPLQGCVILCFTTYRFSRSGEELRFGRVKKSSPYSFKPIHAERKVFDEIKKIEGENNW
jgi:hypothetical protein